MSVKKEIIVDINAYQTRVALLEDGDLAEIYIERIGRERIVGNIYLGRVQNVLPGMQAAFVDIGLEKNAFLYAGDILADKSDLEFEDQSTKPEIQANIRDIVKPGQEIMLQILKEPVGTKGARVTTHITLPGRTLVLMPTVNYIGVSRRIEDESERARLRSIVERIKPPDMGVIVRTAAVGKSEDYFIGDVEYLKILWQTVSQKSKYISAPRLLHSEEALVFRTIRDIFSSDVESIIINDLVNYERLKVAMGIISPEYVDCVHLYDKDEDIFDHYELENTIDKLLSRKVWLKSGGYIIIDQTEALTVIDVNTGKYVGTDNLQSTLYKTNVEAAREIARQLRLRDIGGIIIIDFIDMDSQQYKDNLVEALGEELKKDRTKSNIVGMTGLGLVEMTRKKVRRTLSATLENSCSYCHGTGRIQSEETIAFKIRKQLLREYRNSSCDTWLVDAHPAVAAFIETRSGGDNPLIPHTHGRTVYVRALPYMHLEEYRIQAIADAQLLENIVTDAKIFR